ncbi:MAG TPA: hypothetical protein PLV73_04705 [Treponemataceae bacterium]|nr:hypothetical protein [Treponemataceae bacterium]
MRFLVELFPLFFFREEFFWHFSRNSTKVECKNADREDRGFHLHTNTD